VGAGLGGRLLRRVHGGRHRRRLRPRGPAARQRPRPPAPRRHGGREGLFPRPARGLQHGRRPPGADRRRRLAVARDRPGALPPGRGPERAPAASRGARGLAAPRRPWAGGKTAPSRPRHPRIPPRALGRRAGDGRPDRGPEPRRPQPHPRDHDGRAAALRSRVGTRGLRPPVRGELPHGHPRAAALAADPRGPARRGRGSRTRLHPVSGGGLRLPVPQPLHAILHPGHARHGARRHDEARPGEPARADARAAPPAGGGGSPSSAAAPPGSRSPGNCAAGGSRPSSTSSREGSGASSPG